MSFPLDVLKRVTNVKWGGLAVDFGFAGEDAPKKDSSTTSTSRTINELPQLAERHSRFPASGDLVMVSRTTEIIRSKK